MVDDKDDQNPDPWAGIDGNADSEPAGEFSFSFDSSEEFQPEAAQSFPELTPEVTDSVPDVGLPDEDDEPIIRIDASAGAAEQHDDDPFASLSIDATPDEVVDDGADADGLDEVAGWLEEADAGEAPEQPLAVFPPSAEAEVADPFAGVSGVFAEEETAFAGIDDGQVHDAGAAHALPGIESSSIEIGTGHSGIVSPSDVDAASEVSMDDWVETPAESPLEPDAEGEDPFAESIGFGESEEETEFADDGLEKAGAVAAVAAPLATSKPARAAKRAKGSGLGQMIGIVLGGLMALPITYAILVWGFQKDPFKFTRMVPEQVAFLLPEKFQPGFKKTAALPGAPQIEATASLDNLQTAASEEASNTPSAEPVEKAPAEPGDEATAVVKDEPKEMAEEKGKNQDLFSEPEEPVATEGRMAKPGIDAAKSSLAAATEPPDFEPEPSRQPLAVVAPEPEPLDLTGLEAAIAEAQDSFDGLAEAEGADDSGRKKQFVVWYKHLAQVAEQLVILETVAADSGRPLEQVPEQMTAVFDSIAGSDVVIDKLSKLSGMWLTSKKRVADGAVLLATFDGARQVGPYWSARVTLDGAEPMSMSVISRRQPTASEGERVLVTGVLFDGDVVWAADCRRLAKPAAPAADLF